MTYTPTYLHFDTKPELHDDLLVDLTPDVESREHQCRAEDDQPHEYPNNLCHPRSRKTIIWFLVFRKTILVSLYWMCMYIIVYSVCVCVCVCVCRGYIETETVEEQHKHIVGRFSRKITCKKRS